MKGGLRLFDTLSREQREITAADGKSCRFYCCGPTVYGPAHIGNFRTFVAQDVFRRVMELSGIPTTHVRNITDVDDKTIRDSQKAGLTLAAFTEKWTQQFHGDCARLNLLPPHVEPGAVAHIPQQVEMVARLIEKGHAYVGEGGSVYFRIASFPEYGALSHLDTRELQIGASSNEADEYEKDSVSDFVLWKARKPEDGANFWPSPWGEGRPGWHLECSAMIREYLGTDFDMHSGGVDLVFPHHENELAQSLCCHGGHFAAHWFHVTHLLVDGGKMSKSLGNLYTVDDVMKRGHEPRDIRFTLVSGHYRRPLNFRLQSLQDARQALQRLAKAEVALRLAAGEVPSTDYATFVAEAAASGAKPGPFQSAWASLLDDLNVPEALGHVFTVLKEFKSQSLSPAEAGAAWRGFHWILAALGLELPSVTDEDETEIPPEIQDLAQRRWEAKQSKDWAMADTLRGELDTLGWIVKDTKDGFSVTPKS